MKHTKYVLITAVRNEEFYIDDTIQSVLNQNILPERWVIVSDGSTDRTDEIVLRYSHQYDIIKFIRRATKNGGPNFSSKVFAIYEGYEQLRRIGYDFIGILDGDVTFSPDYYKNILMKFQKNDKLGIAGGVIFDKYSDRLIRRSSSDIKYVSGCIQFFCRKCYEDIGGLLPIKEGGEDTIAVIMARMKGWEVKAFEELNVYHHKHSPGIKGMLKEGFRDGKMSYSIGSHPLFEIFKSIRRISERPYLLHSFARMCGFIWPYCQRQKIQVSDEFARYLRKEQLSRFKIKLFNHQKRLSNEEK